MRDIKAQYWRITKLNNLKYRLFKYFGSEYNYIISFENEISIDTFIYIPLKKDTPSRAYINNNKIKVTKVLNYHNSPHNTNTYLNNLDVNMLIPNA